MAETAYEDSERALIQIYKTIEIYGSLPINKTVDLSEVCYQIARIRSIKGDFQEAIFFYQEALKCANGENYKKGLMSFIENLQSMGDQQDAENKNEIQNRNKNDLEEQEDSSKE